MKKSVIYYFTGTGNTYTIAIKVKTAFEKLNCSCDLIAMEETDHVSLDSIDYVGLMFPVAIQSTFPNVWTFIHQLPEGNGQKIFMIDTMESFSGGIVGPLKKQLERKGYSCIGAIELKMSSSMNTKNKGLEVLASRNKKAEQEAEVFVSDLLAGHTSWNRVPVLSDMMRWISSKRDIWTKQSEKLAINHDQCVKCHLCIKRCPVQALLIHEGKVRFNHSRCVSCMRCVTNCPVDAFSVGGKKIVRLKGQ